MAVNRPLAPSDSLTIREPTDGAQQKGNIMNPPRFANLGIGGMESGTPRGMKRNGASIEVPGKSLRKMPNRSFTAKD